MNRAIQGIRCTIACSFASVRIAFLRAVDRLLGRKFLYFAHPVNSYGTPLEEQIIGFLGIKFPGWIVVNPNSPEHEAGYQKWKDKTGTGLDYFRKCVLPRCRMGVCLPFFSGVWSSGAWIEMQDLAASGPLFTGSDI